MGKRDLGSPSMPSPRPWLAPALLLVVLSVLAAARPSAAPTTPLGIAHYLQAESLGLDFDNRFDERDLVRLRQLPQADDLRVLLARGEGESLVYPGAGPSALLLA